MTTTFVMIYHPALGNVQVTVPEQAVDDYEARGWVLVDGNAPPPSSLDLTAALGDLRYLKLADVSTSGTTTGDALRAAFAAVSGRKASQLTQGLYARSTPTPSGETAGVNIIAKDPNISGRLWGFGLTSGMIGYTDDDLATFHAIQALPSGAAGLSPCQMEITHGVAGGDFMFVLFSSSTANQGGLWRAPAPGASPTSLTFTCIQANDATNNLANGPGAAATHTGDGSNYRNQCFAIQPDGSHAYLVNYAAGTASATPTTRTDGIMAAGSDILALPTTNAFYGSMHGMTITVSGAGAAGAALSATIMRIFGSGKVQLDKVAQTSVSGATVTFPAVSTAMDVFQGPYIRVCSNPCAADPATVSWSITKQWTLARHAHAVKIIGGVPWVNLGDAPYPNDAYGWPPSTHVGMWAATDATGATWNQKMAATITAPYDGINFHPVTIGGQPMIVMESDAKGSIGPIILPTQANNSSLITQYTGQKVQSPVVATMRCAIPTSEGNLMWYGTGESGAVGPVDGVFIAASPFDIPILLEQLTAGTGGTLLNAVEHGSYVYMGKIRITKEKFPGQ